MNFSTLKYIFCIVLFCITNAAIGQDCTPGIIWEKSYDFTSANGDYSPYASAIHSLPNNDIIMGGGESSDAWVTLTDADGNIKWSKTYGGSNAESLIDLLPTSDGGFLFISGAGSSDGDVPNNFGGRDYWLVKLDADGNLIWSKTFGGTQMERPAQMIETSDGGFVIVGITLSSDSQLNLTASYGNSLSWVLKVDAQGNQVWAVRIGFNDNHIITCVTKDPSNDDLIIGGFFNNANATGGLVLSRINAEGVLISDQLISGILEPRAISATNDNGFIITGGSGSAFIVKTDNSGNEQWRQVYQSSSFMSGYGIQENADDSYTWWGNFNGTFNQLESYGSYDFFFANLDAGGNITAIQNFGGSSLDSPLCITETSDNKFIIGGQGASTNGDVSGNINGQMDTWIIKINPCESETDCEDALRWEQSYGYANSIGNTTDGQTAVAIHELPNTDIVFAGGTTDVWITRTDAVGNVIWNKSYGGSGVDILKDMIPTNDGGYVLLSSSTSNDGDVGSNVDREDYWLMKLDSNGNFLWSQTYGGSGEDIPAQIIKGSDNGYVIVGSSLSNNNELDLTYTYGNGFNWAIKVNDQGDPVWSLNAALNFTESFFGITQATNSMDYVISGLYLPSFGGNVALVFLRIDQNGGLVWHNPIPVSTEFGMLPAAIAATDDEGFIITGSFNEENVLALKINGSGEEEWRKMIDGSGIETGTAIRQNQDGGYTLLGTSSSSDGDFTANYGASDVFLAQLDAGGELISMQNFGGTDQDAGAAMAPTADGYLLVGGEAFSTNNDVSNNNGMMDTWIFKVEPCATGSSQYCQGPINWEETYGDGNDQKGRVIRKTVDGNYVLAGDNDGMAWLNKIDPIGNTIWSQNYIAGDDEQVADMQLLPDGGFIIAVNSEELNGFDDNIRVIRTDANGNQIWSRTYGGSSNDRPSSIIAADDGGYVVFGDTDSSDGDLAGLDASVRLWIFKLDQNGDIIWSHKYGHAGQDIDREIMNADDSGYIIAGDARISFNGPYQLFLTKLDENGNIVWEYLPEASPGNPIVGLTNDITQTDDGGYITCTWNPRSISRIDGQGQVIWNKTYGSGGPNGFGNVTGQEIMQTPEGGYIMLGSVGANGDGSAGNGMSDFRVLRFDDQGNLDWERYYGGSEDDFAASFTFTNEFNLLLAGWTESNDFDVSSNAGAQDAWVLEIDPCFEEVDCAQLNINIQADQTYICGSSPITLNAIGGYTNYAWSNGQSGTSISISTPGMYEVIATTSNGCLDTANIEITQFTPPSVFILNQAEYCGGESAILGAQLGYPNYAWSNGSSNPSITVGSPGIYTVTVTDEFGCTGSSAATIVQNPVPVINLATNANDFCSGETITIDAGDHAGYSWSNGAIAPAIEISEPGFYQVTVTSESGCTSTDNITITENALPAVSFPQSTIEFCASDTITLQPDGTFLAYQWSNGGSDMTNEVTVGGTYEVTVTDNNNCQNSAQIVVNELPQPTLDLSNIPTEFCEETVLSITVLSDATSFNWSNGSAGSSTNIFDEGNYAVTATGQNGCTNEASIYITQNPIPDVSFANEEFFFCYGDVYTIMLNDEFESYQWSDNSTSNTLEVFESALYSVTVTNEFGCENSIEQIITQEPEFIADAGDNQQITCAQPIVTLGGNSTIESFLTWTWTNENDEIVGTQAELETETQGVYTITVESLITGCTQISSAEVTVDSSIPVAEVSGASELDCVNAMVSLNGFNAANPDDIIYRWTNENDELVGEESSLDVTEGGTYILVVTNPSNGCSATDDFIVEQDVEYPFAIVSSTGHLQCENDIVTLSSEGSSLGSNFVYNWYFETTNSASISNDTTIEVSEIGHYFLVITNTENNCNRTDAITILDSTSPINVQANLTNEGTLTCDVNTISISTEGSNENMTFEWFNEQNELIGSGENIDITDPGNYTVIGTDNISINCFDSFEFTITQNQTALSAMATASGYYLCNNTSVTLSADGSSNGTNIQYTWLFPSGEVAGNNETLEVTQIGWFTLIVNDPTTGCSNQTEVEVQSSPEVPIATIAIPDMLNCANPIITLNGIASTYEGIYSIVWSNSAGDSLGTAPYQEVSSPGIYYLTSTNNETGCSAVGLQIVGGNFDTPTASIAQPEMLTCTNEQVILDASNSSQGNDFNYQWQDANGVLAETGNSLEVTEPGTYTLQITNSTNGCTDEVTVEVEQQDDVPTVNIDTPDMLTCTNTQVILDASNSSQGSDFEYQWQDENGVLDENQNSLQVTESGTYTLQITNIANGCTDEVTVEVEQQDDVPTVEIQTPQMLTCDNNQVTLDASNSSQGNDFEYQWSNANGLLNETGITLTVVTAGIYQLQITNIATDCAETFSIEVFENIEPPIVSTDLPLPILTCSDPEVTLDASNTNPGSNYSYSWLDPDGNLLPDTTAIIEATQPGSYTIQVVNEENGCSEDFFLSAVQDTIAPIANAGDDATIPCGGEVPIILDGTGSSTGPLYEYAWNNNDNHPISDPIILNPEINLSGVYFLQVTDTFNGCTSTDEVLISDSEGITAINFEAQSPFCYDESTGIININEVIGGTAPYLFSLNNNPFTTDSTFEGLPAGTYTITIKDNNNCTWTETIEVTEAQEYTLSIEPSIQLIEGTEVILAPQTNIPESDIESIAWAPNETLSCEDCLTPTATPIESTTYELQIITLNGCAFSATISVEVEERKIKVWELISPYNVDGKNDDWTIIGIENYPDNTVIVFNRWGDVIYEASPYSNGNPWTGTNKNGKLLPTGTYYYLIKYDLADTKIEKGRVVIVE